MKDKQIERLWFVPDSHHPYVDRHAWDLMLKAASWFKPDTLVVLGDFGDFYPVSDHDKDPKRHFCLKEDIDSAVGALKQLKQLNAKRYIFVEGNHEDRLRRYLIRKAPELFEIISTQSILKLDTLGFEFVPYKQDIKIGKLYITHDCGYAGKTALAQSVDAYQHNLIIGHTHRLGYVVEGNATGERHIGVMAGWLGDQNQMDYEHRIKKARNWSLGFVYGYLDKKTGFVYLVPVPIIKNTCIVEGKLIKL